MLFEFTLPKGCTVKHGRYYLVHKNKWHRLTRVAEGAIPFWKAYYRLTKADPEFMAGVILAYIEDGMGELAQETREKYEQHLITRIIPYCGHIHRNDLNRTHIAGYLQARADAGAKIAGNRERSALSSACEFAMRKGWMTENPCRGVRRNKERQSLGYVQHEPLVTALDRAAVDEPELYCLYGVAYLLGIRQTDLRLALESQISFDPIHKKDLLQVIESKTGKLNEHEITPTVRLLLNKAREHKESVAQRYEKAAEKLAGWSKHRRAQKSREKAAAVRESPYIFVSHRGLPWSKWGLQSALRRFRAGFQFRQLRPKAQTDRPDKDILGHTGQMRERYHKVRKLSAVK